MGTLKCEVCGCADIIKEDGIFVCRGCGMKYSLAEARRLLFADQAAEEKAEIPAAPEHQNEAPEEASALPTEVISFTEDKSLVVARRAKLKEDWQEAGRLYGALEENDPTNVEAIFYAAYSKARATLSDADLYKRQAAFKVLEKSIGLIPEYFDLSKEKEQAALLRKISADILGLDHAPYVYNERKNGFGQIVSTDALETVTLFNNVNAAMIKALSGIFEKYEDKSQTIYLFECRLAHYDHLIKIGKLSASSRRVWETGRRALHQSWQEVDPTHVNPDKKRKLSGTAIFFIVLGGIISTVGFIVSLVKIISEII